MNTTKLAVVALIVIVITPIGIGYLMNVEETQKSSFDVVQTTNVTNYLLNSTSQYSVERVGSYMDNAFIAMYYANPNYRAGTTDNYTQIPKTVMNQGGGPLTTGSWHDVFTESGWNANSTYLRLTAQYVSANEDLGQLRITTRSGSVTTYDILSPSEALTSYAFLYYRLGTLTFQDANAVSEFQIVSNVSKIEINTPYNNVRFMRGEIAGDGTDVYYDYTKGWNRPNPNTTVPWANGMDNSLVEIISGVGSSTMPMRMEVFDASGNSSGVISYWFDTTPGNYGTFIQIGSADPIKLGQYWNLRIVYELDRVTFYGLAGNQYDWPSMGMAYQSSLNSAVLEYATPVESIHYINLIASGLLNTGNMYIRVDRTQSLAGSYPVIYNRTLTPSSLYPDLTSYGVQLTHVDVVGSSISFGSITFPVTNKTITVGNKTVDLEGSIWRSVYDGNEYVNTINGILVSTTATPITMTFNGAWSTIVGLQHMDIVTWTDTEWIPGKFAWQGIDVNFCIIGLITSLGVFIGLGMYGARSGAKVGKLMIICGCAAFVFLALI